MEFDGRVDKLVLYLLFTTVKRPLLKIENRHWQCLTVSNYLGFDLIAKELCQA
jgi:hypothetical protein